MSQTSAFGFATDEAVDRLVRDGALANGTHLTVSTAKVRDVMRLIDASPLCVQLAAWRCDDSDPAPGGRPRALDDRAVIGLLTLAVLTRLPQHVRSMQHLIEHVLGDEALTMLGVRRHPADGDDWYDRCWRALHRLLDVIDPYPAPRRTLSPEEFAEVEAKRLAGNSVRKQQRLDWFANELVALSWRLVPRDVRRRWHGDICIDATPVRAFAKPKTRRSPVTSDPDAAWYVREGDHRDPGDQTGNSVRKSLFGYEVHIAVAASSLDENEPDFPLLATGIAFDRPGYHIAENAMTVLRAMNDRDMPVGYAVSDRAYFTNSEPTKLQLPARALGWKSVSDYKTTQLGVRAGHAGGIQVEGAWYCPSMPQPLIDATIDFRVNKTIDIDAYRERIAQRRRYQLHPKESPDADGYQPLRCPAIGESSTVECPLRGSAPKPGLTFIHQTPKHPDRICTQTSVSFPPTAGAKLRQDMLFGSDEWHRRYSTARNTIEGFNGYVKDPAFEALDAPGRRRVRGRTAQHVFTALLVFAANVRKLHGWLRDAVNVGGTLRSPAAKAARKLRRRTMSLRNYLPSSGAPPGA